MNKPRPNLAESVLARAELYRRGLLFEGVPKFGESLELPAAAAAGSPASPAPGIAAEPSQSSPAAPVPGATDPLVAGAVEGKPPLETMLDPGA